MSISFLHTADWQLGRPFASVEDDQKRSMLQQERFLAIDRIAALIPIHQPAFILVAGDLFDSPSVTKPIVSQACAAIGALQIPVLAIPGNHDHGGPGSLWDQAFFRRERDQLAPNLQILTQREPLQLDRAVILPCPLLSRFEPNDPTTWVRQAALDAAPSDDKPRILLAHGSTRDFVTSDDDEDQPSRSANTIDLDRLPLEQLDYIALGDWHGTQQLSPKAWYSGTPEIDRFPHGPRNNPGHVLLVHAARSTQPTVQAIRTARFGWHDFSFHFSGDHDLARFDTELRGLLADRVGKDLLRLTMTGSIGIVATSRLDQLLDDVNSRLLRLKVISKPRIAPSGQEMHSLTLRTTDPMIAEVASRLIAMEQSEKNQRNDRDTSGEDQAELARIALVELYTLCQS